MSLRSFRENARCSFRIVFSVEVYPRIVYGDRAGPEAFRNAFAAW